jgi:hypothetical protein
MIDVAEHNDRLINYKAKALYANQYQFKCLVNPIFAVCPSYLTLNE